MIKELKIIQDYFPLLSVSSESKISTIEDIFEDPNDLISVYWINGQYKLVISGPGELYEEFFNDQEKLIGQLSFWFNNAILAENG